MIALKVPMNIKLTNLMIATQSFRHSLIQSIKNLFSDNEDEASKIFLENIKKNWQNSLIRDIKHNIKFAHIILLLQVLMIVILLIDLTRYLVLA